MEDEHLVDKVIETLNAVNLLSADGRSKSIQVSIGEQESEKIQSYSHEHLRKFTRNFTLHLGSGAYGDVFKGQLPNGLQVAVKVLKNIARDALEYTFMAELRTLSSTYHRNLVRLYGYCFEADMKALVFEYMQNGSFDKVLYENHLNLQWEKLYDIATETAKGLSYLHESCPKVIIHYDVKAGNVLLDSNLSPKVADFGLSKVSKRDVSHISVIQFRGTRGFAAPEMWMQMPVTYKSDVYSFGMLLFEVLGRRRICGGEDWFPGQVWDMFEKKQLDKLIEDCGIEEKNKEKAKTLSTVALWCTQHSPDKRPLMSCVVQVLEGNTQLQPPPNPLYPYCVSSLASSIYNWIDGSTSIGGPPPSPVSSVGFHSSDTRRLRVIAELRHGDLFRPASLVSSIEFDCDNELFATASFSRRIEVFEFSSVVNEPAQAHCPIVEMSTSSELSCLSWNKYTKNHLASSEFEGIVTVWDVSTRQSVMEYKEHKIRARSVDFSLTEPSMLVSGGDDCKVKVWCTKQEVSVLNIDMKAKINAVMYNPGSSNYVAVGSADPHIHYYDLRNTSTPLHLFRGHRQSVSYVKFLSNNELASASLSSTLRLWDVKENLPVRTFKGHTNKKNLAGLSVNSEYIACGSETNEVFVYHKAISKPTAWHKFSSSDMEDAGSDDSISAVCWKSDSPTMLAANSQGIIKVLALDA